MGEGVGEGGKCGKELGRGSGGRRWSVSGGRGEGCVSAYVSSGECKCK